MESFERAIGLQTYGHVWGEADVLEQLVQRLMFGELEDALAIQASRVWRELRVLKALISRDKLNEELPNDSE